METGRRDFLKLIAAAAAAGALPARSGSSAPGDESPPAPSRPDILVILADDHRHDALGCAGHPYVRTPALDRVAAGGVRFTNAFVTTSLCSPSRASYLTGRYPHQHGIFTNAGRPLRAGVPTYPELLQAAGYETAFWGKWHLGPFPRPLSQPGFDHWTVLRGQGAYAPNDIAVDGQVVQEDRYITDALTARALAFLERPHEKPLLMVLSHKAAHAPFVPAARHADLYAGENPDLYWAPDEDVSLKAVTAEQALYGTHRDTVLDYYRCLAAVDESVAALDAALEKSGRRDNTLVIYTSDNGFLLGEHGGLWDKRRAYEPAMRVPLLVRWPRALPGGGLCRELALNIDLLPSLLEAAGVTSPPGVQGRSWLPVARGAPGRDAFLYEYFQDEGPVGSLVAVRTKRWKYIVPLDQHGGRNARRPVELYDLDADPGELRNLAGDPACAAARDEMEATLVRQMDETGYVFCGSR
ncbi:MAG: sulfatase [bacterium]|nr:sulfatase [bacterium]